MERFMTDVKSIVESCRFALAVVRGDRRGVTAVEYALIAGALVAGIAAAIGALTTNLKGYLGGISFG
jgi:Flp pilus assembly pilin Flp